MATILLDWVDPIILLSFVKMYSCKYCGIWVVSYEPGSASIINNQNKKQLNEVQLVS